MGLTPALDARGHRPGCSNYRPDEPRADPASTHLDLFCDECHGWAIGPRILKNGTDIAWPAGWKQAHADAWRARNGLSRPSQPGSGP